MPIGDVGEFTTLSLGILEHATDSLDRAKLDYKAQKWLQTDGSLAIDSGNANNGTLSPDSGTGQSPGLIFGDSTDGAFSREGIASKRTATGNQYGLDFYTNSTVRLSITNAGAVSIGSSSAPGSLTVNGGLTVGSVTAPASLTVNGSVTAVGSLTIGTPTTAASLTVNGAVTTTGTLTIGTSTTAASLTVNGAVTTTGVLTVGTSTSPANLITNGNVGIGVAPVAERLEVAGNALINGDLYLKQNGFVSLHYGNRGRLGQALNFNPDNNQNGLWLEASADGSESGGLFCNGNTMVLWSPGDNDILRVYDEDDLGSATPVPKFVINGGGNIGIGTPSPQGKLDVKGDIRAGNSDIYFTEVNHNHTGIGNTAGFAAIENATNYGALMILGRAGTPKGRTVKLWDYLQVNGDLDVTNRLTANSFNAAGHVLLYKTFVWAYAWNSENSIYGWLGHQSRSYFNVYTWYEIEESSYGESGTKEGRTTMSITATEDARTQFRLYVKNAYARVWLNALCVRR